MSVLLDALKKAAEQKKQQEPENSQPQEAEHAAKDALHQEKVFAVKDDNGSSGLAASEDAEKYRAPKLTLSEVEANPVQESVAVPSPAVSQGDDDISEGSSFKRAQVEAGLSLLSERDSYTSSISGVEQAETASKEEAAEKNEDGEGVIGLSPSELDVGTQSVTEGGADASINSLEKSLDADVEKGDAQEDMAQRPAHALQEASPVLEEETGKAEEEKATSFGLDDDTSMLPKAPPVTAAITPGAAAAMSHQQCTLDNVSLSPGVGARLRQLVIFLLIPVSFALIIFYSATEWFGLLEREFSRQVNLASFNRVKHEYNRIAQQVGVVSGASENSSSSEDESGQQETTSIPPQQQKSVSTAISQLAALRHSQQTHRSGEAAEDVAKHTGAVPAEPLSYGSTDSKHVPAKKSLPDSAPDTDSPVHMILQPSFETQVERFMEKGQYDAALQLVEQWQVKEPSLKADYYKGLLLARKGEEKEAEAVLKHLLEKDPFSLDAVELLCALRTDCSMTLHELERYYELFPESKMIAIALAQAYVNNQAYDSAVSILRGTDRLSPDADVAFNLAQLYLAKGDKALALQFAQKAADLARIQPTSFTEQQLMALIEKAQR